MNQRIRKCSISWLLVLSMVLGLFGGEFASPQKVKADGEATIEFGTADISTAGYYTYPNLKVSIPSGKKEIHNLTVTADSGYIRVTGTTIKDNNDEKVTGKGILTEESLDEKYGANGGLSEGSGKEDLSTDSTSRYESITFDFDGDGYSAAGASVSDVQKYLRTLQFSTSKDGKQTITITATTLSNIDLKTTINGKEVQLYYYNGHFYGYVPFKSAYADSSWNDAYVEAKNAKFMGISGYLATLTTRGEDRFLYSTFPLTWYPNHALEGWIGCTRMSLEDVEAGKAGEKLPVFNEENRSLFEWRWVTGPEAGTAFGKQTTACGYQDPTTGQFSYDGGFETYDGYFSNWGIEGNIEPNGGITTGDEGFGYYGHYAYGRWNDYPNNGSIGGYYIEFGGMKGDDQTIKDNLKNEVIVSGKVTENDVVNPDVQTKKKLEGKISLKLGDEEEGVVPDARLYANIDELTPDNAKEGIDYTYKWYLQDKNTGVWNEIPYKSSSSLTLTEDMIDHQIKVELRGIGDYEGSVISAEFNASHDKVPITGNPVIKKKNEDDALEPGTILEANVDELIDSDDPNIGDKLKDQLHYTWVAKDPETGEEKEIGSDSPNYVIKNEDQGKDIYVTVKAKDDSEDYTGESKSQEAFSIPSALATPTPTPILTTIMGKPSIVNNDKDTDGNTVNAVGTVLTADIDAITPAAARDSLKYQWYIVDENGDTTAIDGATDKTFTLTDKELNKKLTVAVTAEESKGYQGTQFADPYDTTQQKKEIQGTVSIVNETKQKKADGNEYEVKREGAILTADISGITPKDSQDNLSYQWGTVDGDGNFTPIEGATDRSYELTTDDIDKKLVVKVTGNGQYKGTIGSDHYDTTRTDSDIKTEDKDGKRLIVVTPIMKDTYYAIVDASGNGKPLLDIPTVDENNITQVPSKVVDGEEGYYKPALPGGKLIFTVDKNKQYVIYAKKETTTDIVIVAPDIDAKIKDGSYDDKGTLDKNTDDTISVEVNPADPDFQYAILQKKDGKYYDMGLTYDPSTGEYKYNKDSSNPWTDGDEGKVIFSNLPADGTYKVVAVAKGATLDDGILKGLEPKQIKGGSADIISVPKGVVNTSPTPDVQPTGDPDAGKSPAPSASPADTSSVSPSVTPVSGLTPDQVSRVDRFVEDHGKDPTGDIIKKVDDLTKDIISSGEKEWNNLSSAEQDDVNRRLKEGGCPYTYPQLLEMANAYKIPGFKLHKVMKKGTKSKLKLMKCKGATIVVTSSNSKIATVNKKGVIKAKKKGRATLTITAVKGKYSNRLVINIEVRKKFKNAKELKKFKSKRIKTPTILIAKKRKIKKSTKIKIYGLEKNAKVKFVSYNKKALPINKKGRYTAKKKGKSLMRVTVKQNGKKYLLYLYVTAFK